MWARRWTRERTFALVMISAFGSLRKARDLRRDRRPARCRAAAPALADRAGCRGRCRRSARSPSLVAGEAYSRMPRKVKLSAASQSRNCIASAISSAGSGGGLSLEVGDHLADARQHRPPVLHAQAHVARAPLERLPRSRPGAPRPSMRSTWIWMRLSRAAPPTAGASPRKPTSAPARRARPRRSDAATRRTSSPCSVKLGQHRVEQERHVVVDDLDDRDGAMRSAPIGPGRTRSGSSARRACAAAGNPRRPRQGRRVRARS